jgi:hypothetical protein
LEVLGPDVDGEDVEVAVFLVEEEPTKTVPGTSLVI